MNNIFISSAKKDEAVENFVKSKREELEKMIPGFADDEKFNELVLNFYERGIRDGIDFGMTRMKQQIMKGAVICGGDGWFLNNKRHCRNSKGQFHKYFVSTITHDKPLPMDNGKQYKLITIEEN